MKKNVLLLLLSSLALAGCDFNIDQLKFWEKKDNDQQTPDSAEEQNNEQTEEQPNTDPSDETDPKEEEPSVNPSEPEDEEEELGTYSVTINLSGSDLGSLTNGNTAYQFDDESYPTHVEQLQTYCASKLDATNMLKSINCKNCNTGQYNEKLYFYIGTGYYLNDAFKPGSFKWTSILPMHKVEIKAMPYTKITDGGSTDGQSVVWIDDESHSLATQTNSHPEIQTFSKEYKDGTQSFEIKSTGSRVFLESIKITWDYLYEAE